MNVFGIADNLGKRGVQHRIIIVLDPGDQRLWEYTAQAPLSKR